MASLSAQTTPGHTPAQVVDAAEHAISADSDGVLRARWTAALERDPADREALLGLAALARGTYAFETADTLLTRLLARSGSEPDAWTVQARLGLYRVANAMGDSRRSDSLLRVAIVDARRIGDRAAEISALIGFANTRVSSKSELTATMDTIKRLLPPGDGVDRAEYLCRRGLYDGIAGDSGAAAVVWRGTEMARAIGERRLQGHCLEAYGLVLSLQQHDDSALVIDDSAAVILKATRDHAGLSRLQSRRSDILQAYGRLGEAKLALQQVLAEAEISRNRQRAANAYGGIGMLALRVGDQPTAS